MLKALSKFFIVSLCLGVLQQSLVAKVPHEQNDKLSKNSQHKAERLAIQSEDWTEMLKQNIYFVTAKHISRAKWFKNKNAIQGKPPVLLVVIHGTFAKDSPEFKRDDDPTFIRLSRYAEKIAVDRKASVLLVSFQWSGDNNENRRQGAGRQLARLLNDRRFSAQGKISEVIIVAHSHGGNVAKFASRILVRPLDLLVNLGTPIRQEKHYQPKHIVKLYNLYSRNDPVQVAGSVDTSKFFSSVRAKFDARREPYRRGIQTKNIHIMLNGAPPGHLAIKDMVSGIYELVQEIEKTYLVHDDLVADISFKKGIPELIVSINEYLSTDMLIERQNDIDLQATGILQIAKEVDQSKFREGIFMSRYQKPMRGKTKLTSRIFQNFIDAFRLFQYYAKEAMFSTE